MPSLPFNGATIEEHRGAGVSKIERVGDDLNIDGKKIGFHLVKAQKNGSIGGHDLRKEVAKSPVLDANVLDYLMVHPELIPENWKKDENGNTRFIYFWGTIFRNSDGNLYVRFLYWDGGQWQSHYHWLVNDWGGLDPAAVPAS